MPAKDVHRSDCGSRPRARSPAGITPAEAARHVEISWSSAHEAFAAAADAMLDQEPAPVAHLGIDEHRRGRARFAVDKQTGEYTLHADRWHTCFFDLDGKQGLLRLSRSKIGSVS